MSGSAYKLIPTTPNHVPDEAQREAALVRLKLFAPGARQVLAEVMEEVTFVSAMGNFEYVRCPRCGATLDQAWWSEALDAAYAANGFADLGVVVPCCGAMVSLNDLTYHWPQGFARFVLTVAEPHFVDLTEVQVRTLEDLLGCPVRKIWVHI